MISQKEFLRFKQNETIINIKDLTLGCDQNVALFETDKNKYIVKKQIKEPIKIDNEYFCITKLEDKELPIPKFLYKDEDIIIETYLKGHILTDKEKLSVYKELGGIIKKIHSIKMEGFGNFNKEGLGEYKTEEEMLNSWFDLNSPNVINNPLLNEINIANILNSNRHLLDSKVSLLQHGDLTLGNILTENGKITGVIDFADAYAGPVEIDLSRFYFCCENDDIWNSFIEGYGPQFNMQKVYLYTFGLGIWLISDNYFNENSWKYKKFIKCVEALT